MLKLCSKPRCAGAMLCAVALYALLCLEAAVADAKEKWTPYFPSSDNQIPPFERTLRSTEQFSGHFISTLRPPRPPRGLAAEPKDSAQDDKKRLRFFAPKLLAAQPDIIGCSATSSCFCGRLVCSERHRRALEINKNYSLGDFPSSISTDNITSTSASSFNGVWNTLIPRSDKIKAFLDALQYPFAHIILESKPTTIKIRATSTQGQLNITLPDNLLTARVTMPLEQDDARLNLPTILGPWTGHGFYDNNRFVIIAKGLSGTVYCVASLFTNDPEHLSPEEPIMLMRLTLDGKYIRKVIHSNIWLKKVSDLPN